MSRIYVSSTFSDLQDQREAVYRALRRLGHDVVAMEDYVASDQRPLDRCLDDVASSDVYIGIVAWRYGYVPPTGNPDRLSITELEYRHAVRLNIPCLLFLLSEDAPWPVRSVELTDEFRRFREQLATERVVSFFRTADELAAMVTASVAQLSAASAPDAHLRLVVQYVADDLRSRFELGDHFSGLTREGVADVVWHEVPGHTDGAVPADVVVLLLSPALGKSGYLESPDFQRLVDRVAAGQPQLLPVFLYPMSPLPPVLGRMRPLPRRGSVADYRSRSAAFAEIAEDVRLACEAVLTRRRHTPAGPPTPVRTRHKLVEVFLESGVPTVTFVEPDQFYNLKLALEQPGRGVLLEGPSGVGKTTALESARKELDEEERSEFCVLHARDDDDVRRIRDLRSWHRMTVAIDDFHTLPDDLQREVASYLKLLADEEPRDRKLVIVGIPGTGRRLVDLAFDIATRITVIQLGYVKSESVVAMIEKGESALNIDIIAKADIVRACAGSLNVAQILCRHAVGMAGVKATQTSRTGVATDLPRVIEVAMEMLDRKFAAQVQALARLDEPHERFCIELLRELAEAEDGTLPLWPLAARRPELAASIKQCVHRGLLREIPAVDNAAESHFYYDHRSATLVADDPQLTFYLRNLNMTDLAMQVGKRSEARRTGIFVSYSHHDEAWLKRLQVHLAPLERRGLVDVWADTRIAPGQRWRDEIEIALNSARVAILLVSADFLASDFIRDRELPLLVQEADVDGCRILPLVVGPCLYRETPELARYQSVNPPDQPLSAMSQAAAEQEMVNLARSVVELTRGDGQ